MKRILVGQLSRFPATGSSILFAVALAVLFVFCEFFDLNLYPKPLKMLQLPGVFPMYVLATFTNSGIAAWLGYAVGMLGFYGLVGVVLDLVIRRIRKAGVT